MKKLLLLLLFVSGIAMAQPITTFSTEFYTKLIAIGTVDISPADGVITQQEASNLSLTSLDLSFGGITNLSGIEYFTSLQILNCSNNNLSTTGLQLFSANVALIEVNCNRCQLPFINLMSLSNLQVLNCSVNNLSSLNVSGVPNLTSLDFSYNFNISTITLSQVPNLTYLHCQYCNLSGILDVQSCPGLTDLDCHTNQISSLNVTGLNGLTYLDCGYNNYIQTLDVGLLTGLTYLDCGHNHLTALAVDNLTNLTTLICEANTIWTLNVTALTLLTELQCRYNLIAVLDVALLTNLVWLNCSDNQITTLNVLPLVNLNNLQCAQNSIPILNISSLSLLTTLVISGDFVPAINLSAVPLLTTLQYTSDTLTSLNLSPVPNLTNLVFGGALLTSMDLSPLVNLNYLSIDDGIITNSTNLTSLNMKNGRTLSNFYIKRCPNLTYVCANDNDITSVRNAIILEPTNNQNVEVNSYCSFTPSLTFPISGVATFDNGSCTGPVINNVKINIIDSNSISGATFTNTAGNYNFNVAQSQPSVTITPYFANPSYFTVSPTSVTITNISAAQTQNFCITAVGTVQDLEIVLLPLNEARPGFVANYKLIYKNKGNQMIPLGSVTLSYSPTLSTYIGSNPITVPAAGVMTWNYLNLMPLEARVIEVSLTLNTPMATPPLNGGDILNYTAKINPIASDMTPADNTFVLHQTVVNSFDPNDKTCLEGDIVDPAKIGEYLHYNINFENTGTASAINIVVKDVIDTSKFDISSLQQMDASHPVRTKITGNVVEFIFENINLPPTVTDPTLSHGNVAFKIKTLPTLVIGDQVANTANIYFDYNFPVITNTATSTFAVLSNALFTVDHSVMVYPNPAKDKLTITAKTVITSIQIFDIQGRVLETIIENNVSSLLDISNKRNGVYFLKVNTRDGSSIEKIIKD